MRKLTALVALLLVVVTVPRAADNRPNIIFIMSDDHAAHAISAYGSRVNQTPNIDRLAREGMLLRNVFATNSICTPSRADDSHRPVLAPERRARCSTGSTARA